MSLPYGYRIVGPVHGRRRLIDADVAFRAYASCDVRAECGSEAYLSAFRFGEEFRDRLNATGSTAGYAGECWSDWLWFDLDRPDPADALTDARRLSNCILARYLSLDDDDLLSFFSGSKGFHIGLPTSLWAPSPSSDYHRISRRLAEGLAAQAGVVIDAGVYDRVRAFRAPNSRHPKTGRYKRWLSGDELLNLSLDKILSLAAEPAPFDVPPPPASNTQAVTDWASAGRMVAAQTEERAKRQAERGGTPTLNRQTFDYLRNGAEQGDRHRLLFSAAANLAEFGCPLSLAHALLTEVALDTGLTPSEVRRQIDCGHAHGKGAADG